MDGMDSSMSEFDLDAMTAVTPDEEAILRGDVPMPDDPPVEGEIPALPGIPADAESVALDHVANRVLEKLGPAIATHVGNAVQVAMQAHSPQPTPAQVSAQTQMATLYSEAMQATAYVEETRAHLTKTSQELVDIVNRLDGQRIPSGPILHIAQWMSQMSAKVEPLLSELRRMTGAANQSSLA